MEYPTLFNQPHFDGATYEAEHDHDRLTGQLGDVFTLMKDGIWRTLREIEDHTGHMSSSVSARLRDLRKSKFGGYTVNRKRRSKGLFEYQVIVGN